MSWKATANVKELICALDGAPIPRDAKLVYLILADYHNTTKRAAFPPVEELARQSIMSRRHCYRQLQWLEQHREIRREGLRGGSGRITSYRFLRIDGEDDGEKDFSRAPFSPSGTLTASCSQQKNLPAEKGDRTVPVAANNSDRTMPARTPAIRNTGKPVITKPVKASSEGEKATPDARYGPIREFIRELHAATLDMPIDVVPWNGRAGAALAKWLRENPKVALEDIRNLVRYHYESPARLGMPFHQWIPELMRYWGNGPLNQYGTPLFQDKEWKREERLRREARVGVHQ